MAIIERIYQEVGERIAVARKECGVTQEELARMLGISRPSMANIELGRQRIHLHYVFAIADALGVQVSRLLGLHVAHMRDVIEVQPDMWPWMGKSGPSQG